MESQVTSKQQDGKNTLLNPYVNVLLLISRYIRCFSISYHMSTDFRLLVPDLSSSISHSLIAF